MKNIKLAITGKMGTGKSSVTKIIQNLSGAYVTSYSSVIRKTIQSLDLVPSRDLMQATGDFFRQFDEHVWTNQLLKETENLKKPIVIEGIRYTFEADKLRSNGFKIIKVETSDNLRKKRIEQREGRSIADIKWTTWQKHGTETHVDKINADFLLNNDNSYQELNEKIQKIIEQLKNAD